MEDNMNYESAIKEYGEVLLRYEEIEYNKRLELCTEFYGMLYTQCEIYENERDGFEKESRLIRICIRTLIPILENCIKDEKMPIELMVKYYELYENAFYLASRRSFKHYLLSMELKWNKKVFKPRMSLFEPIIYYLNKMALDNDIKLLRISMPPGYAKSVTVTAFSSFIYGINHNASILRISASDLLVKQFGRDTVNFLKSEQQGKIFPFFKDDRFIKKTEDEFQLYGSNERNFLCKTRDSTIVGFRTDILIEDDLIGGTQEALNNDLHTSIRNKHIVDWSARNKNEKDFKIVSIGTMFNPDDLLCWLKGQSMKNGDKIETPFYRYVEAYRNRDTGKLEVFITIPALDEEDNSTLESEFSTTYFRNIRDSLLEDKSGNGNYYWQSTFMQNPVSPTGLNFGYDNLQTYTELPKDDKGNFLTANYSVAVLDPNRRGKDFISMPIFVPYIDQFYLIDAFFRQCAMSEAYDEIVQRIIKYNIRKLYIEINTDTSLPELLRAKLKAKGHKGCEIVEIYSVINKEQKIKDNQGYIKQMIVFPDRQKWKLLGNDVKTAMEQLISFSFDRANSHDDFPDSLSILVMENMRADEFFGFLQIEDRAKLGI